ncbi:50S ribosomal protein L40e [Candidatus Woesearchaeota archaeon]|nr:MAG: 50S ribosomal protein L40e [Candidatus Woesearchaeota archaeon]
MAKFPEAEARLHKNIFVCRRCKRKIRTTTMRVLSGKVKCRHCNGKALRPIRKK